MAGNDDDQREKYIKYKSGLKEAFYFMGLSKEKTLTYGRVKELMKKLNYKDPTAAMEDRFPKKDQNSTLSFDEFFGGVMRDLHNNTDKISMEKDEAKAVSAFEEYKKTMKAFFIRADTSGDGMLSKEEVEKIFEDLKFKTPQDDVKTWFPDFTKDSKMSFDQFWTGIENLEEAEDKFLELQLRFCFLKHDVDKSGYLSGEECRKALVDQGWTEETAKDCWTSMDYEDGGDSKISIAEFLMTFCIY